MEAQSAIKWNGIEGSKTESLPGVFNRWNDTAAWSSSQAQYYSLILAVSMLVASIWIKSIPVYLLLWHLFYLLFPIFSMAEFQDTIWNCMINCMKRSKQHSLVNWWNLHFLMYRNCGFNFTEIVKKKKLTILPSVTIKNCTIILNNNYLHSICKQQNIQQWPPASTSVT